MAARPLLILLPIPTPWFPNLSLILINYIPFASLIVTALPSSSKIIKFQPKGRKKEGRPKLIWMDWVQSMMVQKGLREEAWEDRDNWRLKIL
jgi:hypothetical protein